MEDLDLLIVGAGISGIGLAWYVQQRLPGTRYAIVDTRAAIGGTWDLFRYPGIRSDSDLYTFGYAFKPWRSANSIADAASIKAYLEETARENGIDRHIRLQHQVTETHWSSEEARWTVHLRRTDTGETQRVRCRWFFAAAGYFRHDAGFTPEFAGRERFRGRIVHPQQWPEGLDFQGQRVVVIGSGATAATIVPAMAGTAAHVTMLQRTPSYVLPLPTVDKLAELCKRWLSAERAHAWVRRKNVLVQGLIFRLCRRYPDAMRKLIRSVNVKMLPAGYPVDVHFNPPYPPWDQRMCIVPDGDLFRAIRDGKASVVTDRIRTFTETGVELESGEHLEADLVITATGLQLQACGGIPLFVDGRRVTVPDKLVYQGMMLEGVPNFAFAMGYTSASWTLRIGLLGEHFCRLLAHLRAKGFDSCVPVAEPGLATEPLLDLNANYIRRSQADLPRQGPAWPWRVARNFSEDVALLRRARVDDPALRFGKAQSALHPGVAPGSMQAPRHAAMDAGSSPA